jgi:hypothetical protein
MLTSFALDVGHEMQINTSGHLPRAVDRSGRRPCEGPIDGENALRRA